jgi:hypothetical protein
LSAQLGRAATRGMKHVLVTARELHSSLGDFPTEKGLGRSE